MNIIAKNTFLESVNRLGRSVDAWGKLGRNTDVLAFDEKTGQFHTISGELKKFCASAASAMDEQAIKAAVERYNSAYLSQGGGDAKMRTLNALRIVTISNFVRALSNWREVFFETVSLKDDERPCYTHTYANEIDVYLTGPDGGIKRTKAVKPQTEVYPSLYERVAGPVNYRVRDILKGDISAAAQKTFDLALDAKEVDDLDHYTVLGTCFGSFTTTGAKVDRTFHTGRNVRANVLPTTNDLTTPGQSGSTKFKWETIKEVLNYCTRFGTLLGGQALRPSGIVMIPADEAMGITDQFNPTGSTNNPTADRIIEDYFSFSYGNVNWILVPDLFLPVGRAIFSTNRKVGHSWDKPSMNMEFVTPSDPQERLKLNREEREYHFVRGISVPGPWKPHAVRVQYHT